MRINVIGSGYMGKQITCLLAIIGFDILIWQKNDNNLLDSIKNQTKLLERVLKVKSIGSVNITDKLSKLENNITIETVIENLTVKKTIFENLSFNENLYSNTSSLKLSNIGENINGFHFMNPVSIKIIELCKIKNYSTENLQILTNELKKVSYQIFNVKDSPGYIVNKILFQDISFFFYLIEIENIKPVEINNIYKSSIKNFDAIKVVNLIGTDTCLQILENLNKYDNKYYVPKILKKAVDLKILGNKNKSKFEIL